VLVDSPAGKVSKDSFRHLVSYESSDTLPGPLSRLYAPRFRTRSRAWRSMGSWGSACPS